MGDSKPLASLSSGLLARKGAARPAMRRQNPVFGGHAAAVHQDDLGWNDMGYNVDPETPQHDEEPRFNPLVNAIPEVVRQQDRLAVEIEGAEDDETDADTAYEAPLPDPVRLNPRKQMALPALHSREDEEVVAHLPTAFDVTEPEELAPERQAASEPIAAPVAVAPAPRPAPRAIVEAAVKGSRRAAFTLRVDPDRHLRLRLACAVSGRSAQQIVTEALDHYLKTLPEIEALAGHLPDIQSR